MPKRSSKPKGDVNAIAFMVSQIATGTDVGEDWPRSGGRKTQGAGQATGGTAPGSTVNRLDEGQASDQGKNPAAVALGRLGGLKGGKVRAQNLSKKRRVEIAQKAAAARWKPKTRTKA